MTDQPKEQPRATRVVSLVLEDGSIVETLFRREDQQTLLLHWSGSGSQEELTLDLPRFGRVAPYPSQNNLLTHHVVLFPSAANEYESVHTLLADVQAFIHRYADLSPSFEEIAAHYILLTWVYDAFNEVPYLRLKGDFGSGKTRCLQTIGSLAYKPMFASGASTASPLFRIIDAFRGTLVIDESDFRFSDERAEIIKIMNNGNAKGFPVLRSEVTSTKDFNPRAYEVFGPKIIATRKSFDDRALESRCITEEMTGLPPRRDIPLSLPESFHVEAETIRNKLLMYRCRNLEHARGDAEPRDGQVEARIAQVFAPLVAVAVTEEARARLRALARQSSSTLRADRGTSTEAQLLDVILEMRQEEVPLAIKAIAEKFSSKFGSDADRPVSPRWIGSQLRSRLSILPAKSHGTFVISPSAHAKLDMLFARYGMGDVAGDVGTLGTSTEDPTLDGPTF